VNFCGSTVRRRRLLFIVEAPEVVVLAVVIDLGFPLVVCLKPADSSVLRCLLLLHSLLALAAVKHLCSSTILSRCLLLIIEVPYKVTLAVVGDYSTPLLFSLVPGDSSVLRQAQLLFALFLPLHFLRHGQLRLSKHRGVNFPYRIW
jgi:hypothetical protein